MTPPVPSVAHAFAILRLLSARVEGMTMSEVARARSLSPSSCLNLLRALVSEGALQRDEDGRRYRLAPAWAASRVLDDAAARLVARAQPALARFAAQCDAAVGLWQQVSDTRLALVALAETGAATRIHMVPGQRQPVGGGSIGRALAAAERLPEAALARHFAALRWQKPLSFEAWLAQVCAASEAGYAIDDGYGHAGICSIGVAMPKPQGEQPDMPQFCLSASIFEGSRAPDQIAALGQALANLAQSSDLTAA
ncbi:helix-turn-helix domain-containing protein [Novosphingobium sp.]|uniref:IclR family transcriptional regulator n=1 Tax=Novosphingobium sp. TaxID=1874826 RepID=UPI0025E8D45A|nr:helix-turn-helix domain-containing protein [Novosphingobium sp.]